MGNLLPSVTFLAFCYVFGNAQPCATSIGYERCMPRFENIAYAHHVYSNNTCGGRNGDEEYVSGGLKHICKLSTHNASLMTDDAFLPTWWQSESLFYNTYPVFLTLHLHKKYRVLSIRLRFQSSRPLSFAIYKKSGYATDETWLPYQFYSGSCEQTYNLPNKNTIRNKVTALCTDAASNIFPLKGGVVSFAPLRHRSGVYNFDNDLVLQEWVTVTGLRFNLDRLNTFGNEIFGEPGVLKSYYYAISDISVAGRCKCNGHAATCSKNKDGGRYKCDCQHNTAGVDCEMCKPLFNDSPWKQASSTDAYPCKACNCNKHSDECAFDQKVWADTNHRSGGRCINCKNNTAGVNCEKCMEGYCREKKNDACEVCIAVDSKEEE